MVNNSRAKKRPLQLTKSVLSDKGIVDNAVVLATRVFNASLSTIMKIMEVLDIQQCQTASIFFKLLSLKPTKNEKEEFSI